jgi:hypothetical protein
MQKRRRPHGAAFCRFKRCRDGSCCGLRSALASLETGIALADHEDLAATTHDFAVTVTGLGRLERVQDFHGVAFVELGATNAAL